MENIREQIRVNLVKLRKEHKLTQLELSERIGYSDKAISRWETGEVCPDVETLNSLAELYEVPISVFFENYDTATYKKKLFHDMHMGKKLAVALLIGVGVWYLGIMAFMYLSGKGSPRPWLAFIWLLPVTFLLAVIFNRMWGNKILGAAFTSLLCWSTLTAVYLHSIEQNLYMLFISGVPIQAAIILWTYIKPAKRQ